ncbi:MAG TPA: tripartite tricarboxylate transporter substrate binding protein [Ramlibacter sp.]|nr:tripartite tricarboxylate transporter substrate binding protein [Ramlibacter sp.]
MRKLLGRIGLSLSLLALGAPGVHAEYPDKPIRIVAATTPGGTADLLARGLGQALSKTLGQPVIVENKPGGDQIIGLEYVAKSQPADGYTAILIGLDGQALLPLLHKNLRFDPLNDFTLLAGVGEGRYAIVAPATGNYKSLKELMEFGKANPGKLNYGSSGTPVRFPSLVLLREFGVDAVHVPYPGAGPYMTAVVGGTIDWVFLGEVNATALRPRVGVLAITGKERSKLNPDVPTFSELGFPQLFGPAYALAVRNGTPKAIVDKLAAAAAQAMNSPEVQAYWAKASIEVKNDSGEVARRTLNDRYKFYEEFVKNGTLKAE